MDDRYILASQFIELAKVAAELKDKTANNPYWQKQSAVSCEASESALEVLRSIQNDKRQTD